MKSFLMSTQILKLLSKHLRVASEFWAPRHGSQKNKHTELSLKDFGKKSRETVARVALEIKKMNRDIPALHWAGILCFMLFPIFLSHIFSLDCYNEGLTCQENIHKYKQWTRTRWGQLLLTVLNQLIWLDRLYGFKGIPFGLAEIHFETQYKFKSKFIEFPPLHSGLLAEPLLQNHLSTAVLAASPLCSTSSISLYVY